jgi:hypothetical protein
MAAVPNSTRGCLVEYHGVAHYYWNFKLIGAHEVSRELELLAEIRDLLQVMAEPEIAKRDAKLRSALQSIVGTGLKKAKAVLLMDGSRPQSVIAKQAGIDSGNISRLVKDLAAARLISVDQKQPKLLVSIPSNFFDLDTAK